MSSSPAAVLLRAASLIAALSVAAAGCEGATTRVDRRFATPERTVHTLLEAYDLDGLSQDAIRGRLAAGRDELRTEMTPVRATVSPREGVRIVMRSDAGAWRIVLRQSVPAEVQRGLATLAARAEEQARRRGQE